MAVEELTANHYSAAKAAVGHHCSDRVFVAQAVFRDAKGVGRYGCLASEVVEIYLAAKMVGHHHRCHHRFSVFEIVEVCFASKILTHHDFLTAFFG